jgi:hypothetical protein
LAARFPGLSLDQELPAAHDLLVIDPDIEDSADDIDVRR